jgi:hypothetical protein
MSGSGHITYRVQEAAHVRISLVNALGQTVEVLHDAAQSAGEHSLSLDASHFSAGAYMMRIESGSTPAVSRPIVIGQR